MHRTRFSLSTLPLILLVGLLALPVLALLASWLPWGVVQADTGAILREMASTVLPGYVWTTLWLGLWVAVGAAVVGTATAAAVTLFEFPGRRVFEWLLLLPLAMPAYVTAYAYTDFLQFSGPLQVGLRETFGLEGRLLPEVRSLWGAIWVFTFSLYPYVYLLARTALGERAAHLMEAARLLGAPLSRRITSIALPLARPAVAAGVALALMETLADYGTVAYFAVNTFTTGIYRAWFSLGDRIAAAQLAAALLTFVVLVLSLEFASRGRARFNNTSRQQGAPARRRLPLGLGLLASFACFMPLLLGFLLPAALLLHMAFVEGDAQFGPRFVHLARNSFVLAALTSVIAVVLAVLLAYAARLARSSLPAAMNRIVGLGYAVPGSVIAVGVLIPVTRLDTWLVQVWQASFGVNPGLILSGGIAALIYAYLARFLAVALNAVESSLGKITVSMDDASRSLGCGKWETLRRVHVPILRGSLLSAALLVFVDVMKELPATLVIRPFNFDTLATQAHTLAADERLAEASTAALIIVAVGLLPMFVISRQILKGGRRRD